MNRKTPWVVAIAACLALTACGINPKKPAIGNFVAAEPAPPSVLPILVKADLAEVRRRLEAELSTSAGPGGVFWISGWDPGDCGGCNVQFGVHRNGPIGLDVSGNQIHWSVVLGINSGRVDFVQRVGPIRIRHAEDFGGEFLISGTTTLTVNEDWQVQASSSLGYRYTERPWVEIHAGPFHTSISVGTMVGKAINGKIDAAGDKINSYLASPEIQQKVHTLLSSAWDQAHTVIPLADEPPTWLRIEPVGISLAGFDRVGGDLVLKPEVAAHIQVVLGEAPEAPSANPLPANRRLSEDDAFSLVVPASISIDEATRQAN